MAIQPGSPTGEPPNPLHSHKQPSQQTRIVNHMNSSHQDSLTLFLQHYCRTPPTDQPTLESISLAHLILASAGKRFYVPFDPPLSSLDDSRQRLKAMHEECLSALQLSNTRLTTYIPPQHLGERLTFIVVLLTMLAFSSSSNFQPGSRVYSVLALQRVPRFAGFCRAIQPWLITAMIGIHVAEAVWMARSRLRRHRVPMGSGVWLLWVGSSFVEGVGSFWRLDALARRMEEEKGQRGKEEKG